MCVFCFGFMPVSFPPKNLKTVILRTPYKDRLKGPRPSIGSKGANT